MQERVAPLFIPTKPEWWHHHGSKLTLEDADFSKNRLILKSHATRLDISQTGYSDKPWMIDWRVVQLHPTSEGVIGRTSLKDESLLMAFQLGGRYHDEFSKWMLHRYNAEAAVQGGFIRTGPFLNIPGPGTGHDGDPNLSVLVDDELVEAVKLLVAGRK